MCLARTSVGARITVLVVGDEQHDTQATEAA